MRHGKTAAAHRKSVEKGVREGIDRLSRQVAESSGAYLGATDSFRRTLETLGDALATAPTISPPADGEKPKKPKKNKKSKVSKPTVEPTGKDVRAAESYVAFVPTSDGYRLIEVNGSAPRAGDDVDAGASGILRVRRVSRSPLPFDERPCAYLERP